MTDRIHRRTHADLRRLATSLDVASPKGLGELLLCYADDWRDSLTITEEKATEITLAILDPWLNSDPCEDCNCDKVCRKLQDRIVDSLIGVTANVQGGGRD